MDPDHITSEALFKLNFKHHWYAPQPPITDSAFTNLLGWKMSSFANNDTFGTLYRQGVDPELSSYYISTSRPQNALVTGNSSYDGLHWTGGPRRESYVPTSLAPHTSSWPTHPSSSGYGEGVWPGDPRRGETLLGPTFGAPGGNVDRSGLNLMRMEVAAPVSEQAFPAAPTALYPFQPCPPHLNWPQVPGPPRQPTSSWGHPVHTARQHNDHSSSIGSFAMRPENSPFQLAASSMITGHLERRFMSADSLASITSQDSVQPLTLSDPVPVTSSAPRSRGERWDASNETTFQCQWTSRCTALVAGNRRSVTNHLRDEHDFTCDGQMITCAWGECTTYMQRRNIPRHIVACHFAIKVTCPYCGLALSRADANKKHRLACTGGKTPAVVEAMEGDEGGYFWRS